MDAYRVKDSGGSCLNIHQIEYAVKKYRGHRKIPRRILEIDNLNHYYTHTISFEVLSLRILFRIKLQQVVAELHRIL